DVVAPKKDEVRGGVLELAANPRLFDALADVLAVLLAVADVALVDELVADDGVERDVDRQALLAAILLAVVELQEAGRPKVHAAVALAIGQGLDLRVVAAPEHHVE